MFTAVTCGGYNHSDCLTLAGAAGWVVSHQLLLQRYGQAGWHSSRGPMLLGGSGSADSGFTTEELLPDGGSVAGFPLLQFTT